jgi:3',5'-cyclic AMP phosphodiesterase CpdA
MRTIAHISDLHFGRHIPVVVEDLLASVNQHRPDLVALSGDFTQRARHVEFGQAVQFLNRISPPKLLVPGNHDVPLYNLFYRFLRPFAKYHRYVSPLGHGAGLFRDDELAILGVNTARRFTRKDGRISLEQIAHIGSVFRDVPQTVFKAIVTHHPLAYPSGEVSRKLAGRATLALQAIADAGVHLLLSGHYHRAVSGSMTEIRRGGSILILHAGTAVSSRLRGEANSYNLIQVAGERVAVHVMGWMPGRGFQESRTLSYAFHEGHWHPASTPTRGEGLETGV